MNDQSTEEQIDELKNDDTIITEELDTVMCYLEQNPIDTEQVNKKHSPDISLNVAIKKTPMSTSVKEVFVDFFLLLIHVAVGYGFAKYFHVL